MLVCPLCTIILQALRAVNRVLEEARKVKKTEKYGTEKIEFYHGKDYGEASYIFQCTEEWVLCVGHTVLELGKTRDQ